MLGRRRFGTTRPARAPHHLSRDAAIPPPSMLTLRDSQLAGWLQADSARFLTLVERHVWHEHPDALRGIPHELVQELLAAAVARARRHGLESDGQVIGFVSLMFEVAPNFDREPVLAALLANRAVPPAERWRRLFAPEPAVEAA